MLVTSRLTILYVSSLYASDSRATVVLSDGIDCEVYVLSKWWRLLLGNAFVTVRASCTLVRLTVLVRLLCLSYLNNGCRLDVVRCTDDLD